MPRGVSPLDAARLQGRLWTPAALGPVHHWRAAQAETSAAGTVTLRDQVGALNVSKTSGSNCPTLNPTGLLGLPAISFDGGDELENTGSIGSLPSGAANSTIVASFYTTSSGTRKLFGYGSGLAGQTRTLGIRGGNVDVGTDGVGNDHTTSTSAVSVHTMVIWQLIGSTKASSLWVNGGAVSTFTLTSAVNTPTGAGTWFGCHKSNPTNEAWNGHLKELFVLAGIMTARERELIFGALAWAQGIAAVLPAAHRFRNRPPLIGD